jgi:hypothetical protein
VTFLNCDVAEAVRGERELRELIDETDPHIAPVLLCDGIRLFATPVAPRSGSGC